MPIIKIACLQCGGMGVCARYEDQEVGAICIKCQGTGACSFAFISPPKAFNGLKKHPTLKKLKLTTTCTKTGKPVPLIQDYQDWFTKKKEGE